jgi:hypothetical protein
MAAASLLINGCTEDEIDRSIRSERLNDRDARLLALWTIALFASRFW